MKIAIIGGGAAGLATAYLLDPHHEVTLYEAAPVLGGHVRTLGGNVAAPPGCPVPLDAGVIEFEAGLFPTVGRLFDRLGLARRPVPATTSLFCEDGSRLLAPGAVAQAHLPLAEAARAEAQLLRLVQHKRELLALRRCSDAELRARALGDYLPDDPYGHWLSLLATYAYSTPREQTGAMGAAVVVPMLVRFATAGQWYALEGGSHAWVQAVARRLRGQVLTSAPVRALRRAAWGVELTVGGGPPRRFDAVVLAVPPGQVLGLLADATADEQRRFAPWQDRQVHTLVHHDRGPYLRRGAERAFEFDLFARPDGTGGYNALLDRLCAVPPEDPRSFGLAFGLDDELDPALVVHRQAHTVPSYTVPAVATVPEIRQASGQRHTWFAGAWLWDGLHEGAVTSAVEVSRALGGDVL